MAETLKDCPFCGGPASFGRGGEFWQRARMWNAGCNAGHAHSPDMDTKKQAAEWWNRRAPIRKSTLELTR